MANPEKFLRRVARRRLIVPVQLRARLSVPTATAATLPPTTRWARSRSRTTSPLLGPANQGIPEAGVRWCVAGCGRVGRPGPRLRAARTLVPTRLPSTLLDFDLPKVDELRPKALSCTDRCAARDSNPQPADRASPRATMCCPRFLCWSAAVLGLSIAAGRHLCGGVTVHKRRARRQIDHGAAVRGNGP